VLAFLCISLIVLVTALWLPTVCQVPTSATQTSAPESRGLDQEKLALEVDRLRWEATWCWRLAVQFGGSFGTVLTVIGGGLGWFIARKVNAARLRMMDQERELTREKHNIELFRGLASRRPRRQLAAAAALLQRVFAQPRPVPDGSTEANEQKTIVDVLVAVLKEKPKSGSAAPAAVSEATELGKYIGDNIVKALGAVVPEGKRPNPHEDSPLGQAETDWQKAQLVDVWWERVDARGIDFFEANFNKAGLKGAFLKQTVFFKASLRGTVLRNADLRGANLQEADLTRARLNGADLTGANLRDAVLDGIEYDDKTKWPEGFRPPPMSTPRQSV
jgi:hypothetical protein